MLVKRWFARRASFKSFMDPIIFFSGLINVAFNKFIDIFYVIFKVVGREVLPSWQECNFIAVKIRFFLDDYRYYSGFCQLRHSGGAVVVAHMTPKKGINKRVLWSEIHIG